MVRPLSFSASSCAAVSIPAASPLMITTSVLDECADEFGDPLQAGKGCLSRADDCYAGNRLQ
jgi:hypothetical protein